MYPADCYILGRFADFGVERVVIKENKDLEFWVPMNCCNACITLRPQPLGRYILQTRRCGTVTTHRKPLTLEQATTRIMRELFDPDYNDSGIPNWCVE